MEVYFQECIQELQLVEIDAKPQPVAIDRHILQRVWPELENAKTDPLWMRHYTILEIDPEGPSG